MQALPLYHLARLRNEEITHTARRAARQPEPQGAELTDVPERHRRWRVRWDRTLRPAV